MKLALKPEDIHLPDWLKRIGKDRTERIQAELSKIHNSHSKTSNSRYLRFRLAFDAIAIELTEDLAFERLYFPIRILVIDLAKELGWMPAELLTPFNPEMALPKINWDASFIGMRPGEPWRGAYTTAIDVYEFRDRIQSARTTARVAEATERAVLQNSPFTNDLREASKIPVRSEAAVTEPFATDAIDCGSEGDSVAKERAELLIAFKTRGKVQGIRITDQMVARAANPGKWNDRTMVAWWKRNDPRCKQPHDRKIRFVLAKEPSSLWRPIKKPGRKAK